MTQMMEQYFKIKDTYKDYLLFYRLGDFYELFFDDAKTASRELGLTLTGRDWGEEERAPMCGVPFHSSEGYIGKLIAKGYKVAICEQMEDPALAKDLVKRDVIRVVTPGTLLETDLLTESVNNYLCAVYMGEDACGIGFADVSTGKVCATSFTGEDRITRLKTELGTFSPSEILCNVSLSRQPDISDFITRRLGAMVSENQPARFEWAEACERVKRQFAETLREEVLTEKPLICAVGALLDYIQEMQKGDISYIKELATYGDGQYLEMDVNTRRNLELVETMRTKEKKGSLLWVLDKTKTAAGARMLRFWVEHPLRNPRMIARRQHAVRAFYEDYMLREEVGALLSDVLDLERLISKIVYGTANAKDLRAVANTVRIIPEVKQRLAPCPCEEVRQLAEGLDGLEDVYALIHDAIDDDPPFSVREGKMIRDGYNPDVDYLRSIMKNGETWIRQIEAEEKEATGIKNLRVGYNKVFGYYIEVTKSNADQVPAHYVRKQTLLNCERYITQELKDKESTLLGAADKICALEYELFQQVRQAVAAVSERIQQDAARLAEVDVYLSLATVAAHNTYVCPEVDNSDVIEIRDGRHPVVEKFVKDTYFVPNDVSLNTTTNRLMLITGPNMAGKSTYMRQIALITVMAQIGSFVPASDARIGIVDKVFTRVGASDDLASGQSTFMLEMNEVAYILRHATRQSLIVYDEIGRGTSTFDGMSIARAIAEYTAGRKIGAKTLFATHYHELTTLEGECEGVINYNIAAKKRGDTITFLRKIIRGSTDDSYGIEVAKLAGLPNEVIRRAKEVLTTLENTSQTWRTDGTDGAEKTPQAREDDTLINLDDCLREQAIEAIRTLDLNTLSPYEAMQFLFEIQKKVK